MRAALLALCEGIHQLPVDSPHKEPVMGSFDICFDVGLNKLLKNSLDAIDLRCHDPHVMSV